MAARAVDVDAVELAALVDGRPRRARGVRAGPDRTLIVDRVSSVMQEAHGYSGGDDGFQQAQVRRDCEARGDIVVGAVSFQGSGRKLEEDALWGVVNDWAAPGLIDVVACDSTSRFARNRARRLLWTLRLQQYGVRVRYRNVGGEDSKETRLQGGVLDVMDEYFGELIAETLANGRTRKAEVGQYVANGRCPYGYTYETERRERYKRDVPIGLLEEPERARWVRQVYEWALTLSVLEITRRLNAAGVPPPGERMKTYRKRALDPSEPHGWRDSTVRGILKNPTYKGLARYGREDRTRAGMETGLPIPVPALVSAELWERVQRRMQERRTLRSGRTRGAAPYAGRDDPFALRGLLRCGHCDATLQARAPQGRPRRYRCSRGMPNVARAEGRATCALHLVDAAALESEAWGFATGVFADGEGLRRLVTLGREEHAREGAARAAALAAVRAEVAKVLGKRKRAAERMTELERTDERYGDFEEVWQAANAELARLGRDAAELAALPVTGLSADEAGQLERVAAVVREGLAELGAGGAGERRRLYGLMGLRGVVRAAPGRGGVRLRAYGAEWRLELGAGGVHSADSYSYLCVFCTPDGLLEARIARGASQSPANV